MDDQLLTAEIRQRYPFIRNFFRTFCITAGHMSHDYCMGYASKGIYKIFNANTYYDKTGMVRVCGANDIDYLKTVAKNWLEMGKNLHCKLDSVSRKCVADNLMEDSNKQMIQFETELNKLRLDIK